MRVFGSTVLALGGVVLLAAPAQGFRKCKADAVRVGTICVDKYEASVWQIPADKESLISAVQKGNITSAVFLTQVAGVTQHGLAPDDYGAGCPRSGNDCTSFYAVSIPGVKASAFTTWFRAVALCRNSGKRLLTNQEWQMAALGTPDPGTDNQTTDCSVSNQAVFSPINTGSRSLCVSDTGAFDMVGNLWEWVAAWDDLGSSSVSWPATYGTDTGELGGDGSFKIPGALLRGGDEISGAAAGVFYVNNNSPASSSFYGGFRCAREP